MLESLKRHVGKVNRQAEIDFMSRKISAAVNLSFSFPFRLQAKERKENKHRIWPMKMLFLLASSLCCSSFPFGRDAGRFFFPINGKTAQQRPKEKKRQEEPPQGKKILFSYSLRGSSCPSTHWPITNLNIGSSLISIGQ